ncbi:MAG: hypothetical protein ACREJM_08440 [Candidatus Saccharimonadales bacterium]
MNALRAVAIDTCDDALSAYRRNAFRAVRLAQAELDHIAQATDLPDWQDVDAADLLDATATLLARETPT